MRVVLLLLALLPLTFPSNVRVKRAVQVLIEDETTNPCHDCASDKVRRKVDDKDLLHQLRVNYVKDQILKKLQLKDIPNVVRPESQQLPVPLTVRQLKPQPPLSDIPEPNYYALTNQLILLSQIGMGALCSDSSILPKVCFGFLLSESLSPEEISSAELWVYKNRDILDGEALLNFNYREINQNSTFLHHPTRPDEGWIKLNVTKEMRDWLAIGLFTPVLEVTCPSCGYSTPWTPVSLTSDHQPLLVINVEDSEKKRRLRRNINCRPGVSECCREKLYISFKELGWDDWLLQPEGYEAYFCTGSCTNVASVPLRTLHASAAQKSMVNSKRVLVPCCSPTLHSDLQIIYMDNNVTVTSKTLPNMVVQACGCM